MSSGQPDVTIRLPDELLCHVFNYLSLKEKLCAEQVNVRFQRCIINELKTKPMDLNLLSEIKLNQFTMVPHQLLGALQTLSKKAKFSTISIVNLCVGDVARMTWLEKVLTLFLAECQCLTKVTTVTIDSCCHESILGNFLDKCEHLSKVNFDFNARPVDLPPSSQHNNEFSLDFGRLFKNRALTELHLRPYRYDEQGLIELFRQLKPNKLEIIDLFLYRLLPEFNVLELVSAIGSNAGRTLTELNMQFMVTVVLADLFTSLSRLTALRKCAIICYLHGGFEQQLVSAATSLFNNLRNVCIDVTVHELQDNFVASPPACHLIRLIQQVQIVHPLLAVQFEDDGCRLVVSLKNARIAKTFGVFLGAPPRCQGNCLQCKSFYPCVLSFVRSQTYYASTHGLEEEQQFLDWRLDRCRVDQLLENLRIFSGYSRPLSAEISQDQQMVTLRCQSKVLNQHIFAITLACGQCISNGCLKCI